MVRRAQRPDDPRPQGVLRRRRAPRRGRADETHRARGAAFEGACQVSSDAHARGGGERGQGAGPRRRLRGARARRRRAPHSNLYPLTLITDPDPNPNPNPHPHQACSSHARTHSAAVPRPTRCGRASSRWRRCRSQVSELVRRQVSRATRLARYTIPRCTTLLVLLPYLRCRSRRARRSSCSARPRCGGCGARSHSATSTRYAVLTMTAYTHYVREASTSPSKHVYNPMPPAPSPPPPPVSPCRWPSASLSSRRRGARSRRSGSRSSPPTRSREACLASETQAGCAAASPCRSSSRGRAPAAPTGPGCGCGCGWGARCCGPPRCTRACYVRRARHRRA